MAQSDNTMVLKLDGKVIARASLDEEMQWSIEADTDDSDFLESEATQLQKFSDDEQLRLSPSDGDPRAAILTRAAFFLGWEVEGIHTEGMRLQSTP